MSDSTYVQNIVHLRELGPLGRTPQGAMLWRANSICEDTCAVAMDVLEEAEGDIEVLRTWLTTNLPEEDWDTVDRRCPEEKIRDGLIKLGRL